MRLKMMGMTIESAQTKHQDDLYFSSNRYRSPILSFSQVGTILDHVLSRADRDRDRFFDLDRPILRS